MTVFSNFRQGLAAFWRNFRKSSGFGGWNRTKHSRCNSRNDDADGEVERIETSLGSFCRFDLSAPRFLRQSLS